LGISAVALAGLIALADNAAAQEKRQGSGERREGTSSGERREGANAGERREGANAGERREGANAAERREGERLDPGARVEGEFRSGGYSGGYYAPYNSGYYGPNRGWYGGRGWYGDRGWYGSPGYSYGYPMYDNGFVNDGYSNGYSDDGRRGRFFGGRRGGDYSYGSYGSGSSCHGGCHGGYGSSCHGGYGAGCTGGSYYGGSQNGNSQNGNSYGAMSTKGGALIQLKVPADATVTFDDQPTQQTGEIRQFITPALEANKNFSYSVHVKSQNMDETRKIKVSPDKQVTMDFTMPQAAEGQRAAPEQAPAPGRKSYGATKEGAHHEGKEAAPAPGAAREGAPAPAPAAKEENAPQAGGDIHEGTVVSFSNGKLEMTDPEHGKHSHQLAPDTKVFIDGQPAKAEDLKADMKIKVTNKKGDQQTITRIDAQSKGKNEAQPKANNGALPKAKNNEAPPPQP